MSTDNWLKASHLMSDGTYQKYSLTVKEVDGPDHGRKYENGQRIEGFILRFDETDKELVIKVGSTNHKLIRAQCGEKPALWIGQRLTVFPVVGDWFKQQNILGIRVWVDEANPRPKIAAKDMGNPVVGVHVGSRQEKEYEEAK